MAGLRKNEPAAAKSQFPSRNCTSLANGDASEWPALAETPAGSSSRVTPKRGKMYVRIVTRTDFIWKRLAFQRTASVSKFSLDARQVVCRARACFTGGPADVQSKTYVHTY